MRPPRPPGGCVVVLMAAPTRQYAASSQHVCTAAGHQAVPVLRANRRGLPSRRPRSLQRGTLEKGRRANSTDLSCSAEPYAHDGSDRNSTSPRPRHAPTSCANETVVRSASRVFLEDVAFCACCANGSWVDHIQAFAAEHATSGHAWHRYLRAACGLWGRVLTCHRNHPGEGSCSAIGNVVR